MARIFLAALLAAFVSASPVLSQQSSPESTRNTSETHRVTGIVIDDLTGKPLNGATVQLEIVVGHVGCLNCGVEFVPPPLRKPEPPRHVITGTDGSFAFDNVPDKSIFVSATKPGYFDARTARRRPDETGSIFSVKALHGPITLRLFPEASISGIVREHNGELERKNAYVSLWHLGNWGGWPRLEYDNPAQVGPDGTYHFGGLRPGQYYLVADPPFDSRIPPVDAQGHAAGEIPVRYPELAADRAKSFFTLRAGESVNVDFRFSEQPLYHVSGVLQMNEWYSFNIIDENGSGAYSVQSSPFDKRLDAWLPNGIYRVSTGREGEVTGPLPFEVKGGNLSDLSFSIATSAPIEVPVEISSVRSPRPACPDQTLACGFFQADLVRFMPGGYVEVIGESSSTNKVEGNPPKRVESVSLIPGEYTVAIAVTNNNVYAKSIVSGATDLAVDRLLITAEDVPQPIQITLAEGAIADGIVLRQGNPVRAWVYAVALDIESKTDFRVFQPVTSQADGKFRIEGLAPGSYLFFASDIELPLDVHDSAQLDYWRRRGKIAPVESGKATHLILDFALAPDVP